MAYLYSRSITCDHTKVPSDRSGLPIVFLGTYSYLATVANGGGVQNSSGYDIGFFSDSALTTKLKWDLVKYVPATGEIEVWVRIPTLSSSSDTVIYLAYGDSGISTFQGDTAGTWTGTGSLNAKAVYHYNDGTTLTVADSTGFTTPTNHGATATTGEIDGAANFVAGSSQYIDSGADSNFDFEYTDSFTATAWIKPNITRSGGVASYALVSKRDGSSIGWEMLLTWDGTSKAIVRANILHDGTHFIQVSGATDIANGAYAFVGFTYNGTGVASGLKLYVSGVLETMSTGADSLGGLSILNAQNLQIGARNAGAFFNGAIDEVHVFPSVRAADGLLVEYRNQSSPGTFYTVGSALATPSNATATVTPSTMASRQLLALKTATTTRAPTTSASRVLTANRTAVSTETPATTASRLLLLSRTAVTTRAPSTTATRVLLLFRSATSNLARTSYWGQFLWGEANWDQTSIGATADRRLLAMRSALTTVTPRTLVIAFKRVLHSPLQAAFATTGQRSSAFVTSGLRMVSQISNGLRSVSKG